MNNTPPRPLRWRHAGLLAALLLALGGCASVGPDYRPLAPQAPAEWHAAHITGDAGQHSLERWWQQFGDAQLVALIEQSFRANPDLLAARASLRASRALERAALADRDPGLTASASSGASKRGGAAVNESWVAGFDADWEIDLFGGIRRGIEAAQADSAAAAASLADAHASLAAEVALDYITLRTAQARLQIAQRNLASQEETLQITDWRAQAGLASSVDVEQSRTNTEQTRAQIPSLRTSIASAANRLSVLTGEAPGRLQETLATGRLPDMPAAIAVGIPADVLRQRPDVRAAERTLAAEVARTGVAEADRYPSFRLSGTLALESVAFSALGNGASVLRSITAGISGVLFDGGRLQAQVDRQDAVREKSLQNYRGTVLGALEDVENALTAVDNTGRRREALAAASAAARNANLLAADRYRSGLIDFATVLETQRSLLTTEDSLASAEGDRLTALVQLYKALGGGWSAADASDESNGNPS
ncbi:efflux transporter outer membrane subunit [Cognatazoarcus halotolerans]|uniref:efflux transporter outer membrane subunit n=1 Tax=Cognatazoarcus halotolerans TaxID=2686016 RepID=UPI00135C2DE0|nr:efflux transporter outer membrane subunit [Cognatazoarcus halotolerans]MCB1900849.1 efflux transporter outer membrane subunit [Rhodocyclaceae bacterium]MCP5308098.1 efflux transporter outer membrane subunit [Zoogloeaceae bacterium]